MRLRKMLVPLVVLALAAGGARADVHFDQSMTKSSAAFRQAFETVVEKANKATVEITCDGKRSILGTIVSADGYILTKASELKGKIAVRVKGRMDLDARIIGVVADDDLAMIKVSAGDLPVVEWAPEQVVKKMEVGDWVAASGTISEKPLAVGIVSVNRRKIPAQAGMLGVGLADSEEGKGAKVQQVLPESGAEKAGVKVDDVITSVNGRAIHGRAELVEAVRNLRPGDLVRVKLIRAGKDMELTVTLGSRVMQDRSDMQMVLMGPTSKRASAFPAVIQHDAVLRPSDCGGPLVNLDGRAIGLNIARAGRTETYAIPSDLVIPLIKDLKAGKYATATAPATKLDAPATTSAPATRKADPSAHPAPLK